MSEKEKFEKAMREVKEVIKTMRIPDCDEILDLELVKDRDGNYKDVVTSQFYQIYLMGLHDGISSTLKEMSGKENS